VVSLFRFVSSSANYEKVKKVKTVQKVVNSIFGELQIRFFGF